MLQFDLQLLVCNVRCRSPPDRNVSTKSLPSFQAPRSCAFYVKECLSASESPEQRAQPNWVLSQPPTDYESGHWLLNGNRSQQSTAEEQQLIPNPPPVFVLVPEHDFTQRSSSHSVFSSVKIKLRPTDHGPQDQRFCDFSVQPFSQVNSGHGIQVDSSRKSQSPRSMNSKRAL